MSTARPNPATLADGLLAQLSPTYCAKVAALPIGEALELELQVPISVTKKLVPALTKPCCTPTPPKTLRAFTTLQELADWINSGDGNIKILCRDYKGVGPAAKRWLSYALNRLGLIYNVKVDEGNGTSQAWEGNLNMSGFGPLTVFTGALVQSFGMSYPDVPRGPVLVSITTPAGDLYLRDLSRRLR